MSISSTPPPSSLAPAYLTVPRSTSSLQQRRARRPAGAAPSPTSMTSWRSTSSPLLNHQPKNMDFRSGRHIASSGEKRRLVEVEPGRTPSVAPDRISALPDDLLLLVLARLRCVAAAARTCVLARRWRLLWTQLPALVFPDVSYRTVATALDALLDSPATAAGKVSLLDIRVAGATRRVTALLRDATLFQPEELLLAVPSIYQPIDLPRFDRTTSICLSVGNGNCLAQLRVPPAGDGECLFPALTTLVLSGYYAKGGLAALLPHCPRLRVLRYAVRRGWPSPQDYAITVHSATLRELVVKERAKACRVDVATPMLNQLTVSCSCVDRGNLTVSIVAPVAEKVSWRCCQSSRWSKGTGCWYLKKVRLMTPSSSPAPAAETARRRPWLLRIDARIRRGRRGSWTADRFEKIVENHLRLQVAADLSAMDLELHLTSDGHVYGALVLFLLRIRRVRAAVRRLKLALLTPEGGWRCNGCGRCEPTEWRSQTVSLTELEEVEIDGFQGEDHGFEFLEVISRCAPMLRRVTVKPLKDAPYDARIRGIFKAHPLVECCVLPCDCAPLAT